MLFAFFRAGLRSSVRPAAMSAFKEDQRRGHNGQCWAGPPTGHALGIDPPV